MDKTRFWVRMWVGLNCLWILSDIVFAFRAHFAASAMLDSSSLIGSGTILLLRSLMFILSIVIVISYLAGWHIGYAPSIAILSLIILTYIIGLTVSLMKAPNVRLMWAAAIIGIILLMGLIELLRLFLRRKAELIAIL